MRATFRVFLGIFVAALSVSAQGQLQVDKTSIGGTVVNSATGKPEAGVWVIAETKLGVPFRKIVVTDDQGRFLVPDLPAASYDMWVRGYGLKDSAKTKAERGAQVKLQVADAATPQEAAKIYPAAYWTSLIHAPSKEDLPAEYKSQEHWLAALRGGCNQCHQLGMPTMRGFTTPDLWDFYIKKNGGMEKIKLAFYAENYEGSKTSKEQPWSFWRLEGPGFVWNYRVLPHVHTYVNISSKLS